MNQLLKEASKLLGGEIAPDHLKLALVILFTYPSAVLFKRLPSASLKHAFSIAYTTLVMLSVLQFFQGYIHIVATSIASYIFMKYTSYARLNFVFVMISMFISHHTRAKKSYFGDTVLDYSGAMMILTIKLTSFGFNVMDGRLAQTKKLSEHDEKMKLTEYPSLVQYFGWIFFFSGFFTGPTIEYMDYVRFTETRVQTKTWTHSGMRLAKSLVFVLALVYLAPDYNYFESIRTPWDWQSLSTKILSLQLTAVLIRSKYYAIWYMTEGASIMAGLGFKGYDGQGQPIWNKTTNARVLSCEFAQSLKELTENWNIGANHWLRHYVYLRFDRPGSVYSTMMTYVISALWHGFDLGFYVFFVVGSVLQIVGRQVRKSIRPLSMNIDGQPNTYLKPVYNVCTWAVTMGILNLLVPCFDVPSLKTVYVIWYRINFIHLKVIAAGTAVLILLMPVTSYIQKKRLEKYRREEKSHKKN
ncbi:MBOAT, membrane-bound O-acyltransferase family-domain-containing protein [Sporodiniella umbellata]|nr:MBOAT, membrane-bound O-acyltransferase family-domain-containing protein [Sporodiniella umbellata]